MLLRRLAMLARRKQTIEWRSRSVLRVIAVFRLIKALLLIASALGVLHLVKRGEMDRG